jgi:Tfp pilus assembly protein FimV
VLPGGRIIAFAMGQRSPAHLLAPAALAAFTIVVALMVAASLLGSDSRPAASTPSARHSARAHRPRRFHTVRPGETLSSIAASTHVPIERLQELNPALDPQAIRPGQRVKLRR